MEQKNERKIYFFLLVLLCLISFGLGYYYFKTESSKEIKHFPITDSITLNVIPIIPQDTVVTYNYVGYVEAINQVDIIPYISGYLQNIAVKPGQFVQENDLLINIQPDEYKARLESSEASVLQASADFDYNQNYYERVQKSGNKAFSEVEISNAKNNYLQAYASLINAKANKSLAQVNYDYTIIRAPISGLLGNFTLSEGDYVSPNSGALLNIVQTDPIRVVFSLTDIEYLNMKEDGALFKDSVIKLRLPNGQIFEHNGEFKYTNNQINKNTNSLAVYVYFKNDKNDLLPNTYVTVNVDKTFKDIVLIDKNYVQILADGYFINIARNNKIISLKIDIFTEQNNQYIAKNIFQPNDLLIIEDIGTLNKDAKIDFKIIK